MKRPRLPSTVALAGLAVVVLTPLADVVGAATRWQGETTSTSLAPAACTEGTTFKRLRSGEPRKIVVKATRANVRRLPGLQCDLLREFKRGKHLAATGRRARSDKAVWLEVKDRSFGRGWIYEGLVRDD